MQIIPSGKIELLTALTGLEVREILRENIRPKRALPFEYTKEEDKLFEGTLEQNKFEIQQIIRGRNSFLPQMQGKIEYILDGTKITINLKIHGFVIVFMTFWLGFVVLALIVNILAIPTQGINLIALIVPFIMLVFGIGLVHFGFNIEKDKAINNLKRILSAEIQ